MFGLTTILILCSLRFPPTKIQYLPMGIFRRLFAILQGEKRWTTNCSSNADVDF